MDAEQLHILQHALGLDQHGRGTPYRNHFVTGSGSIDHVHCMALVDQGLMTRRAGNLLTGCDDLFNVTRAGLVAVKTQSPPAPNRTRSQQRYQAYLDAGSHMTFGEWLRGSRA